MNNILNVLNKELKSAIKPIDVRIGDFVTIKMKYCKSILKSNIFSGICISKKEKGYNSKLLIRGSINKQLVEKSVPIYSSLVESIIVSNPKVINSHKAKLYYLRNKYK